MAPQLPALLATSVPDSSPGSSTGVDTTLHWVLSGNMASEAKCTQQDEQHTQSQHIVQVTKFDMHAKQPVKEPKQKAKLDTTRRGKPVSRPTARPGGLATDNTAGSRGTPMASGCGAMHVNARSNKPTKTSTTCKPNV